MKAKDFESSVIHLSLRLKMMADSYPSSKDLLIAVLGTERKEVGLIREEAVRLLGMAAGLGLNFNDTYAILSKYGVEPLLVLDSKSK